MAKSMLRIILLLSLTIPESMSWAKSPSPMVTRTEVERVVRQAAEDILGEQKEGQYWLYPSSIGMMYVSQYYVMTHWLGVQEKTSIDPKTLRTLILQSQLQDGSWELIPDPNLRIGDINPTIYHYWALKVMGESPSSSPMVRARQFVLKKGGLQKASQFTRVFLSLLNNLSWEDFPAIPYFLFESWAPVNENQFAQWVGSHLNAIAYLQKNRVSKNLGPQFSLEELKLSSEASLGQTSSGKASPKAPEPSDEALIRTLLLKQQKFGSFGGYTPATQLSMAVIDHYLKFARVPTPTRDRLKVAFNSGFEFLEDLSVRNPDGAYKGVACDGRYWDTALVGQGLIEAGVDPIRLQPTVEYLMPIQNPKSGGYGFGYDFENYEDTDDTAEILLFYKKAGYDHPHHQRALQWLLRMQNADGGWGAFAKNNTGNLFLEAMTKDFLDSADLFDESSPDVTGHIIEALAAYGYTAANSPAIRAAVKYLRQTQVKSFGGWEGRWGVNYIYGTSAALIGLLRVGVPVSDPAIQKALNWLESCPKPTDGGFGESFLSYTHENFKCGGRSTASQTAWAMMALIEGGRAKSPAVWKAASYLVSQYQREGRWIDVAFVGTGHPRIVPMDYPAYPKSFPLMALGRYLKEIQSE